MFDSPRGSEPGPDAGSAASDCTGGNPPADASLGGVPPVPNNPPPPEIPAAPPAQLSLALRLPAGVAARVAIPLLSTITEAGSGSQSFSPAGQPRGRLWEAGSLVWSRGAFVAGVRGISTTEATRGGVVELEVASGSYQFMLTQ